MYVQLYAILLVCVEPALPMTLVAALRDTLGKDVLKQVRIKICNNNCVVLMHIEVIIHCSTATVFD